MWIFIWLALLRLLLLINLVSSKMSSMFFGGTLIGSVAPLLLGTGCSVVVIIVVIVGSFFRLKYGLVLNLFVAPDLDGYRVVVGIVLVVGDATVVVELLIDGLLLALLWRMS